MLRLPVDLSDLTTLLLDLIALRAVAVVADEVVDEDSVVIEDAVVVEVVEEVDAVASMTEVVADQEVSF